MFTRTCATSVSLLFASSLALAAPTHFEIDPAHSGVTFKVRHLLTKVPGSFKKFSGTFDYDPQDPKAWKADVKIEASSVNTDNDKRDKHLRSPDFFDTSKYPEIKFVSTGVTDVTDTSAKLNGNLTMHGVTKPVTIDLEIGGEIKDPQGALRAGFNGTSKVNRKDFGIVWNKVLDTGKVMLGDDVEIAIAVEGVAQTAKK